MIVFPLIEAMRLPASSVWREQQGVHAVDGAGMFCLADSSSTVNSSCLSWAWAYTVFTMWGLSMLHLLFSIWHDSPKTAGEEAWRSELIHDVASARREAQREVIVALCDGPQDVTPAGRSSSSQIHPEEAPQGSAAQQANIQFLNLCRSNSHYVISPI